MGDEEREPRFFTLTEAERTRAQVEPILIEAMEQRRKIADVADGLGQIVTRIQLHGGVQIPFEQAARLRVEHNRLSRALKSALEQIEATGCVVKDLEIGLLDFPALINNEEVYLCWKLGEDHIRFWHRQDEGYAGRKPLDPRDSEPERPVN